MSLAACLILLMQDPSAAELAEEFFVTAPVDHVRARRLLDDIIRLYPDSPQANWARQMRRQLYERSGPALSGVLARFFFGTVLGWWILFATGFLLTLPLLGRLRAWRARRRFVKTQANRLSNPQDGEARFQLAQSYLEAGRWSRALASAVDAIAIAGSSPVYNGVPYSYLRLLGQALFGLRRYPEAVEAFERALKVRSDVGYHEALLGLAKARYRMGEVEKALEFSKHAVADHESDLESYFRWAQAAARLGRPEEVRQARANFRHVLRTLPRFARQRRLRWRLAFLTFPVSRRLG